MRIHDRTSFFKYVSAEVAKIIILNKTLRWSSPLLFNDPFDVVRELAVGIKPSEMQECIIDSLIDIVENEEELPSGLIPGLRFILETIRKSGSNDLKEKVIETFCNCKDDLINESQGLDELKRMWEATIPEFRILCLSARNDNAPMWNHYADKYKGVVLEFACREDLDSAWLIAKPVQYPQGRPSLLGKIGWGRLLILNQKEGIRYLFHESSYTKTPDWSYEQEWRVVSFKRKGEQGEYSDYTFHPKELAAIYLGPNISQEDQEDIKGRLNQDLSHVELFSGKISGGSYIEFD
jgi:hypothetical protein